MKVDVKLKRCNCRSIGECNHNITAELDALETLSKKFSRAMFGKLRQKFFEGYHGWNDEKEFPTYILKEKLLQHIKKGFDEDNCVDIANLAMMIWNHK